MVNGKLHEIIIGDNFCSICAMRITPCATRHAPIFYEGIIIYCALRQLFLRHALCAEKSFAICAMPKIEVAPRPKFFAPCAQFLWNLPQVLFLNCVCCRYCTPITARRNVQPNWSETIESFTFSIRTKTCKKLRSTFYRYSCLGIIVGIWITETSE